MVAPPSEKGVLPPPTRRAFFLPDSEQADVFFASQEKADPLCRCDQPSVPRNLAKVGPTLSLA